MGGSTKVGELAWAMRLELHVEIGCFVYGEIKCYFQAHLVKVVQSMNDKP